MTAQVGAGNKNARLVFGASVLGQDDYRWLTPTELGDREFTLQTRVARCSHRTWPVFSQPNW